MLRNSFLIDTSKKVYECQQSYSHMCASKKGRQMNNSYLIGWKKLLTVFILFPWILAYFMEYFFPFAESCICYQRNEEIKNLYGKTKPLKHNWVRFYFAIWKINILAIYDSLQLEKLFEYQLNIITISNIHKSERK